MANKSADDFKRLVATQLPKELHDLAVAELKVQAGKLSDAIAAAAPVHEGTLRTTVHVVPGSKDTIVRVVAGGHETIRPSVSAHPYDYARADEFGTVHMRARPFFFPTYRRMRLGIRDAMREKIKLNIKKYSVI